MKELTEEQWRELRVSLEAPFPPESIDFRVMRREGVKYSVAAYLDKVAVINRLNELVGVNNWEYDFEPIVIEDINQKIHSFGADGKSVQATGTYTEMTKAKGRLTIYGVTRCGLGTMSNTEFSKGCDSDAFKRSAVMFGIGAYLYDLPKMSVEANAVSYGQINANAVRQLKAQLPVPQGYVKPVKQQSDGNTRQVDFSEPDNAVRSPAQSAPKVPSSANQRGGRPPQTPINGGSSNNPRTVALNDYNAAKQEMGFPLGEDWEPLERDIIAKFLKRDETMIDRLTPQQLQRCADAVRDGTIKPWPSYVL